MEIIEKCCFCNGFHQVAIRYGNQFSEIFISDCPICNDGKGILTSDTVISFKTEDDKQFYSSIEELRSEGTFFPTLDEYEMFVESKKIKQESLANKEALFMDEVHNKPSLAKYL